MRPGEKESLATKSPRRLAPDDSDSKHEISGILTRTKHRMLQTACIENELFKLRRPPQKGKRDINSTIAIEEDSDEDVEIQFKKIKSKEHRKALTALPMFTKEQVQKACAILDPDNKRKRITNKQKRLHILKRYCSRHYHNRQSLYFNYGSNNTEHSPNSLMYIVQCIRSSILIQNWNNVTKLLLLLLKQAKKSDKHYVAYAKVVAELNFMMNTSDSDGDCLQQFQQFFVQHNGNITHTTTSSKEDTFDQSE